MAKLPALKQINIGEIIDNLDSIKIKLDYLTDDERKELFDNYCLCCGSKDNKCQCWNDE